MALPHPNDNQAEQEVSDEVQQLEDLRKQNDNPPESEAGEPGTTEGTVEDPQSKSRSAIFRHRGITEAKKSSGWDAENTPQRPNEESEKFSGVQYSPTDLAAYVFSTGDEEGVAVAVEELVREGMMGRTDAINYLQDVKQALRYMKENYDQMKRIQEIKNKLYSKPGSNQQETMNPPHEQVPYGMGSEKREQKPQSATTTEHPQQVVTASTSIPKLSTHSANTTPRPKVASIPTVPENDEKKRRVLVETAPTESPYFDLSSLEEVFYQMARDMFTQSLVRGDQTAEETLSRLVTFMEREAENKRMSSRMKEKIIEIISAALVESLRQYQQEYKTNLVFNSGQVYRRQADSNPPSSPKSAAPEAFRKLAGGEQNDAQQLHSTEQKSS